MNRAPWERTVCLPSVCSVSKGVLNERAGDRAIVLGGQRAGGISLSLARRWSSVWRESVISRAAGGLKGPRRAFNPATQENKTGLS